MASVRFNETTDFYPTSFSDQLSTTHFRNYLYNNTPFSLSDFFSLSTITEWFSHFEIIHASPVGEVFRKTSLPTDRAFFYYSQRTEWFSASNFGTNKRFRQNFREILYVGSLAHDPNAETGSRCPHITKVIEITQSASCLKNQSLAGFCMLREINRVKF